MWILKLLLMALIVLSSSQARAQDGQAEKLLQQGINEYGGGEFERSLQVLTRAKGATKDQLLLARVYMRMGLSYGMLEQKAKAKQAFAAALKLNPEICPKPPIKPRLIKLCQERLRGMRGTLSVTSDRADSEVWIDGKVRGKVPQLLKLPIGTHQVVVKAPGRKKQEYHVVVLADQVARIKAEFRPPVPIIQKPPTGVQKGSRGRLWTWIAAGGAVVMVGVGAGLMGSAVADHNEYQDLADRQPNLSASEVAYVNGELTDGIHLKEGLAWGAFAMGGALAVTAAVLFFTEGRSREAPSPTKRSSKSGLRFVPMLGQATGVGLEVLF